MTIWQAFLSEPEPCVYLPEQAAQQEYRLVVAMSGAEYEALMEQGWRKFGAALYRPVCASCQECRSLRVSVPDFTPSRSQRRARRRNADLSVEVAPPTIDAERLALYNRYHAAQCRLRGWPPMEKSAASYRNAFLINPIEAIEIAIREPGGRLLAIVLADVTPGAVSGVYHYHDPQQRARSLGTFAMLQLLDVARKRQKRWAYFGYRVEGCPSLAYKASFRPHQILTVENEWVY